ncbi:MAG: undecaprenyl-diphosphate phosphatase [Eubacteriales bacterium]|nr:undecaprenyl-diphosphate phosphatase [Eubacteriales bacterium]
MKTLIEALWLLIKALIYAIVEGITEWLPVSSTGHLIILERFLPLNFSPEFRELFLVVIQLAAIFAVVFLFWSKLWPFQSTRNGQSFIREDVFRLWFKILVASIPAGIFGVLLSDWVFANLYGTLTVAIMLIVIALALWAVELKRPQVRVERSSELTYGIAVLIGIAQIVAAALPGTSRSGICILAGLLLGLSRPLAAEFSFFMAIPAMAGASLLEIVKLKYSPSMDELILLVFTSLASFLVSLLAIERLLAYIRKNSFKPFAIYRLIVGFVLLGILAIS